MSSLNAIRLPDGSEIQLSEWLHWPLFSVIEFATVDAVSLDAFSYTIGNTVPHTATVAARSANATDTNMVRAKAMNQDEAEVVFAITYELFGLTTATAGSPAVPSAVFPLVSANVLRRLQVGLVVELKVGANIKKPQVGVPFSYIGQGIGQHAYCSGDLIQAHMGWGGDPVPRNQKQLNLPIYIGGFGENAKPGNSMAFFLRTRSTPLIDGSDDQSLRLRWWLDGLKKRPA